jgi:oxygen-independent coproporphyrinogen III oxidase
MKKVKHLYVHVPFCPKICPYCCFHVTLADKKKSETFLRSLVNEYISIQSQLDLDTLYLGGGTPTALSTAQLESLLKVLLDGPDSNVEATSECNPSTLSLQKAKALTSLGVNRLSIGAQSFNPEMLKALGRSHSVQAINECVKTARSAGFSNINLDLIFGIPGQSLASWKETLDAALSLNPQHLSCYGLTYEEDTDFFLRFQKGELKSNDAETEMFEYTEDRLAQAGFGHYEISNYALPGFECRHNQAYWRGIEFQGIGPSAVSTVRKVRRRNSKFDGQSWKIEDQEILSNDTLASERMALGLRTSEGVDQQLFESRFGFKPGDRWAKVFDTLAQNNLLQTQPVLQLTNRGRLVADEIATNFF